MPDVEFVNLGLANDKIVSVQRTSGTGSPGTTDTYTITLRSGDTYNFNVTNGANGASSLKYKIITGNSTLANPVAISAAVENEFNETADVIAPGIVSVFYESGAPGITRSGQVQFSLSYINTEPCLEFYNFNGTEYEQIQTLSVPFQYLLIFYYEETTAPALDTELDETSHNAVENMAIVSGLRADYVPKTRTVAGLNLGNDITENALFDKMNIKNVYATLTALQTANPNHGYCYLVEENNHWYYYNGSAWTDGGEYKGNKIKNGSIDYNKLDEDLKNQYEKVDETLNVLPKNISSCIEVIEENTLSSIKAYYNSTYNLIGLQTISGNTTKIYQVQKGKHYQLYCNVKPYTGASEQSPVAVIGTTLITTTSETTPFKQAILIAEQTVPHTELIDFTALSDGYLYANNAYNLFEYEMSLYNIKDDFHKIGLIKNDNGYIHFIRLGTGKYLCREFRNVFVNNLFQLYSMYIGRLRVDGTMIVDSTIGTSYSDVVGPVSIHRGNTDNWIGRWSGGSHGVTINNVEYPTAAQSSIDVYVNNQKITENGIYFGNATVKTINLLYYPQTVTGSDLTSATLAITETRIYTLKDTMNVIVRLQGSETSGYIASYYGCQCNTYNMNKIYLPSNEKAFSINPTETYYWDKSEHKFYCTNGNAHYDVELKNFGLGSYNENDGQSDLKYGNVSIINKVYFQLIASHSGFSHTINTNKIYQWEAVYNYYYD